MPTKDPSAARSPQIWGIVGGIASGKSVVAGLFADLGFEILDADRVAAELMASPALQQEIEAALGPGLLSPEGLDRQKLADTVFQSRERLALLESLVHPRVRAELLARLEAAVEKCRSVLLDVPLLLEKGLSERCEVILFLEVPEDQRRARALARGMSEADWGRREATQLPIEEKRARATHVLDNSGSIDETRRALRTLIQNLG